MIRLATVWLAALVVAGCATTAGDDWDGRDYRPLWTGERYGWVRLVKAEPEAQALAHPATVSASALRQRLAELPLIRDGEDDGSLLFNDSEVEDISGPVARGLAEAQPDEEVVFAVTGRHGALGVISAPTVTTGRVFVRDGRLELILGQAQEGESLDFARLTRTDPEFVPGRRASRVASGWRLDCELAGGVQRRADWCGFPLNSVAPAGARSEPPATPAAQPTAEPAPANAAERLRTLKNLLDQGLITSDDYEMKKQEILDQL